MVTLCDVSTPIQPHHSQHISPPPVHLLSNLSQVFTEADGSQNQTSLTRLLQAL